MPGQEFPVRVPDRSGAEVLSGVDDLPETSEDYILLCDEDARVVQERNQAFSSATLRRLKDSHEQWIARVFGDDGGADRGVAVSVLVHTAVFLPSSPTHYFIKITNESPVEMIQIDRVWFATDPSVLVDNEQRPLPALLAPGEMFETWKPTRDVPRSAGIEFLVRAQLGDGRVVPSRPNTMVSPAGQVGGGGRALSALAGPVAAMNRLGGGAVEKDWHVFISHATEDKDEVVRPLAHALRQKGLRVWYDEFELGLGDSLRRKLDEGIARSVFGVVVLSPAFFAKPWTNYELDGLVTRSVVDGQVILPLWHDVALADVVRFSPSLADKIARSVDDSSLDDIAEEISKLVRAVAPGGDATPQVD